MNNNSYINKTSLIREICEVNQPIPKSKTSKKKIVNNNKNLNQFIEQIESLNTYSTNSNKVKHNRINFSKLLNTNNKCKKFNCYENLY